MTPATHSDLFARLRTLTIETTTIEHPAVFTVAEAKALRGPIDGGHCKNLFLRNKKGRMWLVAALEDTPTDLKHLANVIGAGNLSFASEQRLWDNLGVIPGSVTPFALINDTERRITPVLDSTMMTVSPLNFHPLRNDMTTAIMPGDLVRFIESCGHAPKIVPVGPQPPG